MDKRPVPPRLLSASDELAELVLGYLADHPHAADTLLGIAEWWVVRQQIRVDLENLQLALDELTRRGLLQVSGNGDQRRYRLFTPPGSSEVPPRGRVPGEPHAPRR